MNNIVKFQVAGHPVQWARAGRGNGATYTPAKQRGYMSEVKDAAVKAYGKRPPFEGRATIDVIVVKLAPKSLKAHDKKLIASGELIPDIKRPDSSNYLKLVEDALNTVVIKDDSQFWDTRCRKFIGNRARLEVTITFEKVKEDNPDSETTEDEDLVLVTG